MLLAPGGCTSVELAFQSLPDPAVLDAIEPGRTTRMEVVRLLGPPDDMRRPAIFERVRRSSPEERKIIEAQDVFGTTYTYAAGRDTRESFGIMPMGPALFRVSWLTSRETRWRIEFDEADVVTSVSRVDELEERRAER